MMLDAGLMKKQKSERNSTTAPIQNFLVKSIAMLGMVMLFACSNDMKTVEVMSEGKELSTDVAKNVHITYSDSGKVKMRLSSNLMKTYSGMKPHITMPEGLRVRFYNSEGVIKSTLKANYAISYEKSKIMEARNDVVVVNSKGEKLNTEHLTWNQRKNLIISDDFVKITTDDRILFGEGLKADETMNNWTIQNPEGEIFLEEDFTAGNNNKKDTLPED